MVFASEGVRTTASVGLLDSVRIDSWEKRESEEVGLSPLVYRRSRIACEQPSQLFRDHDAMHCVEKRSFLVTSKP